MSVYLYGIDATAARNPFGTLGAVAQPTDVTIPVDFSDGAAHTVVSKTIPGGIMGANGKVIVEMFGSIVNGGARSISASDGIITTNVSQSLGADSWFFEIKYVVQNKNSESSQLRHWWQDYGRQSAADSSSRNGATSATNTANDWTMTLMLTSSGVLTSGTVDSVEIQVVYLN